MRCNASPWCARGGGTASAVTEGIRTSDHRQLTTPQSAYGCQLPFTGEPLVRSNGQPGTFGGDWQKSPLPCGRIYNPPLQGAVRYSAAPVGRHALMPPLLAVAFSGGFPTTGCGTGGDKPRPYEKSGSGNVGAGLRADI